MSRLLENKWFFASVCGLFLLAMGVCLYTGGPLPTFGLSILPGAMAHQLAQSPFPPPNPWPKDGVQVAQSPFPPPPPRPKDGVMVAQSPFPPPPPRPKDGVMVAQSPFPPPPPRPKDGVSVA